MLPNTSSPSLAITSAVQPIILIQQRKGGTGKTMLACTLSAYYASRGVEHRLVDCDLRGDLRNKMPAAKLIGLDDQGIALVRGEVETGLPVIIDFGANTSEFAKPMIDQLLTLERAGSAKVTIVVPYDDTQKSRIFVVEMIRDFTADHVLGVGVENDLGPPPPPKPLPENRRMTLPRLSPRLAQHGYDRAAQSIANLAENGLMGFQSKHGFTAIAARAFVQQAGREFVKHSDLFFPSNHPQPSKLEP